MRGTSDLRFALATSTSVGEARARLRAWLAEAGVSESDTQAILVAVGEATTNAVEHSGAQAREGRPAVCMRAVLEHNQVRVTVSDQGQWRERPAGVHRGHRGRGRTLMNAMVDQVHVRIHPSGTTVELVKDLAL